MGKVLHLVDKLHLPLRQSYTFVLKGIYRDQRFRNHPKNRKKALRADRKLRTIAGRLVRELKRNLGENSLYTELIDRFQTILSQRRNSRKKLYSIHEAQVQCISKGKEHKKYEFGNKVSIIRSATGIILGAMSFRNEYDGHTIEAALGQVERLTQRKIKILAGDRGYRGRKEVNGTQILIPDSPKPSREQISKAQETQTILQAGRHRTYHWTFESRSSFRPQLLQRCGRRRCKHTDGCSCLQLQKSHESSFVAAQNNKREAGKE